MNKLQKLVLTQNEMWQLRRAQRLDESFACAVRRVCEENHEIQTCYLLDARKERSAQVNLLIALSVDQEERDLENVVLQFQRMLGDFPEMASKTMLISAKRFQRDYSGAEFYIKKT